MKAREVQGRHKIALRLKGFAALQMACTTVHAGRCIAGSGGLIHRTIPLLGVLAAMHCHKRQGTRSAIVAVRAHRSPAQLQRQQYQQENKQMGAGVHPENCSGIPGGTITFNRRPMQCPAVSNRSHSQARQHNKLVILRCASCWHTVSDSSAGQTLVQFPGHVHSNPRRYT